MWIWIILAIIVIAGLFFWMKSGKKDEGMDVSSAPEVPEMPQAPEAPAPTEMSTDDMSSETPETPKDSSDEENPM